MTAAGLNIAALARTTGVPAHTLRKWEQRYGVLSPVRTAGGQRRYSDVDVARVRWLRARLGEGFRISEAAALLVSDVPPAATAAELRDALLAAVERSDPAATEQLLDQAFALHPLDTALDEVAAPVLAEVGRRWDAGSLSVGQEHLVTSAVRTRVLGRLADRRPGVRGRAVLACAPGERHEVGLLTLAALLAADGWRVVYLGADTPVADALAIARDADARVVCFSVTLHDHREGLLAGLGNGGRSRTHVVVGGQAGDRELARAAGTRYAGSSARAAVPVLARLAV